MENTRSPEAPTDRRDRDPMVDHPDHYGGADNPYEVIKVLEAWKLDAHRFNAVKYIARAGKEIGDTLASGGIEAALKAEVRDLRKAIWYLNRLVSLRLNRLGVVPLPEKTAEPAQPPTTPDPHSVEMVRRALRDDLEYARAWWANIVMSLKDNGNKPEQGALAFINMFSGASWTLRDFRGAPLGSLVAPRPKGWPVTNTFTINQGTGEWTKNGVPIDPKAAWAELQTAPVVEPVHIKRGHPADTIGVEPPAHDPLAPVNVLLEDRKGKREPMEFIYDPKSGEWYRHGVAVGEGAVKDWLASGKNGSLSRAVGLQRRAVGSKKPRRAPVKATKKPRRKR